MCAQIRKIIHIDMDAFFAAVEQRDHPEFRGKPVIVGGDPQKRGVVSTCSYEARKFGIHSAMPTSQALRLCPNGIFIHPRFEAYREVSTQIREIFHRYTDLVEPLSLDEAYLDVTHNTINEPSATRLAQRIKQEIYEKTKLTASAGVSFNKFLAKVGSDWNKPDGLTVIPPEKAVEFIAQLPIRKFYGIGKVTEQKMLKRGIKTGADLMKISKEDLRQTFGKMGEFFYNISHCQDDRPVNPHRGRKSISKETTLPEDIDDLEEIIDILKSLTQEVVEWLNRHEEVHPKTLTLKVRYENFTTVTRSTTQAQAFKEKERIFSETVKLLKKTEAGQRKVRLLGIGLSKFH